MIPTKNELNKAAKIISAENNSLVWMSFIPKIPAPAITGIDNKNENFADSLAENPKNKERDIVIPDLDIPGIIANACPRPITMEVNNECLEFLFLKADDKIKTKPVNNKA